MPTWPKLGGREELRIMFEGFTNRGRRVAVEAQQEARTHNHSSISTEHILLGLIRQDEGVAAVQILNSMGISPVLLRRSVEEIVGEGPVGMGQQRPTGHIPFAPPANKVLELAQCESLRMGHNYVGTEHILLGLIREAEGVAAQVLIDHGADLDRTRQQVQLLVGVPTSNHEWTPPQLRPARDRILTVIEPLWRMYYHRRRAPSTPVTVADN